MFLINQLLVVFRPRYTFASGFRMIIDIKDKRQSVRHRVLKDGKIVMLNNWSVIDCCIRDISETGARIRCSDAASVPDEFRLLIPSDNTIRNAKVVWRRSDQCGVLFTGPPRPPPPRKW
jgi:PilZ domain